MREINDEQVVLKVGTKGNTQVPIANCFFIKKMYLLTTNTNYDYKVNHRPYRVYFFLCYEENK